MAPQVRISHPLRMITQRLKSVSTDQLPYIASHLTNALLDCGSVLGVAPEQINKGSEESKLLHLFKTQISNLLQHKSVGARWTAALLVKTALEVGGLNLIQGISPWVGSLLGFLRKPDPASVKKTAIITLTRIFLLTHGTSSVVRDITTPALPTFISHCLDCISTGAQNARTVKTTSPLLKVVFQAFTKLLPFHPNTFRPYLGQLRLVLAPFLAPTPSDVQGGESTNKPNPSKTVQGLAQRLYALLSYCAPKNGAPEQWSRSINALLGHAHRTTDHVFRALVEEDTDNRSSFTRTGIHPFNETVGDQVDDEFGLQSWSGVVAGSERLVGVLHLLQAYIATSSQHPLSLPVSLVWILVERLLSVFGPSGTDSSVQSKHTRHNPESDRDEREDLWRVLPRIHEVAIELNLVLIDRVGSTSISFAQIVMERITWAFERDIRHNLVRMASYETMTRLLEHIGPSLSKPNIVALRLLIESACSDCTPQQPSATKSNTTAEDSARKNRPQEWTTSEMTGSAISFLEALIAKTRPQCWPAPLRASIDRTAIMLQYKSTITASVLNPPFSNSGTATSILPFLARAYPDSHEAEAILRPRLPIIRTGAGQVNNFEESEEELDDYNNGSCFNKMEMEPSPPTEPEPTTTFIATEASKEPDATLLTSWSHTVESTKRSLEQDTVPFSIDTDLSQPESKRLRAEEELTVQPIATSTPSNAAESMNKEKETLVASALVPNPTTDASAGSSVTTRDDGVDGDSDSSSDLPSIHIDSDLYSTDEDEDGLEAMQQ